MINKALKIVLISITPITIVVGIVFSMIRTFPFSYADIDLNKNGIIGFGEAEYILNYDTRVLEIDGQKCREYFALKDGLTIKVVCGQR